MRMMKVELVQLIRRTHDYMTHELRHRRVAMVL